MGITDFYAAIQITCWKQLQMQMQTFSVNGPLLNQTYGVTCVIHFPILSSFSRQLMAELILLPFCISLALSHRHSSLLGTDCFRDNVL